jgi:hypothetical protein
LFPTSGIIHVDAPSFCWHYCLYLVEFITCKRVLLYSHSPLGRATRYVLHLTCPDYSSSFSLVLGSQPTQWESIRSNSRCSTSWGNKRYLGSRCSTSWVTSVSSLSHCIGSSQGKELRDGREITNTVATCWCNEERESAVGQKTQREEEWKQDKSHGGRWVWRKGLKMGWSCKSCAQVYCGAGLKKCDLRAKLHQSERSLKLAVFWCAKDKIQPQCKTNLAECHMQHTDNHNPWDKSYSLLAPNATTERSQKMPSARPTTTCTASVTRDYGIETDHDWHRPRYCHVVPRQRQGGAQGVGGRKPVRYIETIEIIE